MANLIVPNEYPTIQLAVNSASAGDKILVLPNVYEESVIVTKSNISIEGLPPKVQLQGANQQGVGINIVGNNITLKNFIISNYDVGINIVGDNNKVLFSNMQNNASIGIIVSGINCMIKSCGLDYNGIFGLDMNGSNNCCINSRALGNGIAGISNTFSILSNSKVVKCYISSSLAGINFVLTDSNKNFFQKNRISNIKDISIAVAGNNNTVLQNSISLTPSGISILGKYNMIMANSLMKSDVGITINDNNNTIMNNFIQNSSTGIILQCDSSKANENKIANSLVGIVSTGKNITNENKFSYVNTEFL